MGIDGHNGRHFTWTKQKYAIIVNRVNFNSRLAIMWPSSQVDAKDCIAVKDKRNPTQPLHRNLSLLQTLSLLSPAPTHNTEQSVFTVVEMFLMLVYCVVLRQSEAEKTAGIIIITYIPSSTTPLLFDSVSPFISQHLKQSNNNTKMYLFLCIVTQMFLKNRMR